LGGGTPCYAGNMEVILKNKKTTSIYLQTRIKTLVERLENGKQKRPLVKELSNEKLVDFVAKHLFERSFFYEQAQEKISTNNKVIEEILTEIRILLH
jgi:shikimate kinase